ncbi:hypothetical protein WDU94_002318 [Cyamophila willieti]
MNTSKVVLAFLLCLVNFKSNSVSVLGATPYYDITTVYKFNTQEESNDIGDTIISYFNTCTVSVHPQTNALGLPYYVGDNNVVEDILYPSTSTIPRLSSNDWKSLSTDGETEVNLEVVTIPDDTYQVINEKDLFDGIHPTYTEHSVISTSNYDGTTLYNSEELMNFYRDSSNLFLHVDVPLCYPKDFVIRLIRTDEEDSSGQKLYDCIQVNVYHYSNSKTVKVCATWLTECEESIYEGNSDYQIILYISLQGRFKIYDGIAKKVIYTDKTQGHGDKFKSIEWSWDNNIYERVMTYKIFSITNSGAVFLAGDRTYISPWFHNKNNFPSSLFISYMRRLGTSVVTYLKELGTDNVMELEYEEQIISTVSIESPEQLDEIVLTKVHVRYPDNWVQNKQIQIKADPGVYIRDIWEGGYQGMYTIHDNQTCEKSKDITDIYDVALRSPTPAKASFCLNGGVLREETCVCPPGFTGDTCEIACGRNFYGQQCSNECSGTGTDCKGIILCTPSYGCSCAPGYHGDKCTQQCEQGTYGADCKQSCGQCKDECDIYTGHCRGQCDTPYLTWPTCKKSHSYWKGTPEILDSNFTSVKVGLNLSLSLIEKSSDVTRFYMIQYKEETDTAWINGSYKIFRPDYIEHLVDNLKEGKRYSMRVLLVDKTLKTNDPKLSRVTEALTKCRVSELTNNLHVIKVTNTSIALTWNKESGVQDDKECAFSSYILEIVENQQDTWTEHRKIVNINKNSFVIRSLLPGTTYDILLKKTTVHGESSIVSRIQATTDQNKGRLLDVTGVRTKTIGSEIYVQWFKNSAISTYYIKYRLLKQLACSHEELPSPLQVVSTKSTNYTLKLAPNALYEIFVTGDETLSTSENKLTETTEGKLPDIAPILLRQEFRITNESAAIYWKDAPDSCQNMNGFFENYFLTLVDKENKIRNTYETKDRKLELIGLNPKTRYNLTIKYVNHIGKNEQIHDASVFSTKATSFLTAQDLTAYKTSANSIGIRWKMPDSNSTITRIEIKVQNHSYNNSMNITNLSSVQCKAWPSYSCYDITKLKQNTKYIVSVEMFSEEFPDGGSHQSVQIVTRETAPTAVSDIKVVHIANNSLTVSWRIPSLLNGILRKFLIEVEHLSSFDETLCCQAIATINHAVTEEKETYSHVIEIQSASSYQVTIRAFTKRLGQESSKIIDIPPPLLPIKQKPSISVSNEEIVWDEKATTNISSAATDLVADILVIVLSEDNFNGTSLYEVNSPREATASANDTSTLRSELNHQLKSNNWWIAHVCPGIENCSVKIGTEEQSESLYGEIDNKPLLGGNNYTIVLAQVNKYLSARSFTILKSTSFRMKGSGNLIPTTTERNEPTDELIPREDQDVRDENENKVERNHEDDVVTESDVYTSTEEDEDVA